MLRTIACIAAVAATVILSALPVYAQTADLSGRWLSTNDQGDRSIFTVYRCKSGYCATTESLSGGSFGWLIESVTVSGLTRDGNRYLGGTASSARFLAWGGKNAARIDIVMTAPNQATIRACIRNDRCHVNGMRRIKS